MDIICVKKKKKFFSDKKYTYCVTWVKNGRIGFDFVGSNRGNLSNDVLKNRIKTK